MEFHFEKKADLDEEKQRLGEKCSAFRSKLIQLSSSSVDEFLEHAENEAERVITRAERDEEQMTRHVAQCGERHADMDKQYEQIEQLRCQIKIGEHEKDSILRTREELESRLKTERREVEQEGEGLEQEVQSSGEQREQLTKSAAFFMERLGLQFKKISGGRLQVVMTCLDHKEPERPFVFCVKIMERSYTVSDVQPPVANIDALITTLNKTNDFSRFIHSMRQAFKNTL